MKPSRSVDRPLLEDNLFLTNIFNTIPFATLIVDSDVRLFFWNSAASALLGADKKQIYKKRGGDAMLCIHSTEAPGGCGRAASCRGCIIRNSVGETIHGGRVHRRKTVAELLSNGEVANITLLITTAPVEHEGRTLCLLLLEDITELIQLRSLLPICANCKKVRNDRDYWESIEGYIKKHIIDVDFTHGICPECCKKLYPEYFPE